MWWLTESIWMLEFKLKKKNHYLVAKAFAAPLRELLSFLQT